MTRQTGRTRARADELRALPKNILGLCGSLRRESWNRAALHEAQALCPAGHALRPFDLAGLPVFNQDEEQRPPAQVVELKDAIRAADAVLFVTPEYNYSLPGGLKNAIDWASRPYGDSAWRGKPAAIMGASSGMLGSARAQYHLRQVLVFLDMPVVNQPEVMIAHAAQAFAAGRLDAQGQALVGKLLQALVELAGRR